MGNFNRGNRFSEGKSFERRRFGDRGSKGTVQMHQVVCGKCGKDCEVPFRPTNDRPVFCNSCFETNRTSDSRSSNFDEREMFTATCADCGNSCQVPFRPTSGKPVFCSNCFGEKKGARGFENKQPQVQSHPQYKEQFEQLNNKLDKILTMLAPTEQVKDPRFEEQTVNIEQKTKIAKKKLSKKAKLSNLP